MRDILQPSLRSEACSHPSFDTCLLCMSMDFGCPEGTM